MTRSLRLAVAWALLIAFLCLTPGEELPQWEWADLLRVDKLVHALMFGVLTFLLASGFRSRPGNPWPDTKVLVVAGALSFGYGGLMELLQGIPGLNRQGDLVDLTANSVGALLGAFLIHRVWERRHATE